MANKILLIIGEDALLSDAIMRRLQDERYDVKLVRDGEQGLQKIREFRPNLVVLDSELPNMSGMEILSAKSGDPSIVAIPSIILMKSDEPSEVSKVLALGAKDYLLKSQFDQELLVNKISQQLNQTGLSFAGQGGDSKTADKKPTAPTDRALSDKKVMWVEDDAFLSEIIARKLSAQGCALVHATSGDEALTLIAKEHPDIVLLDILLPGMDGFEILRRMKEDVAVKDIPVILLSNLSQKSDIEKGQKLGAERFLVKALVSLDEIISEIEAVLAKQGKSQRKTEKK